MTKKKKELNDDKDSAGDNKIVKVTNTRPNKKKVTKNIPKEPIQNTEESKKEPEPDQCHELMITKRSSEHCDTFVDSVSVQKNFDGNCDKSNYISVDYIDNTGQLQSDNRLESLVKINGCNQNVSYIDIPETDIENYQPVKSNFVTTCKKKEGSYVSINDNNDHLPSSHDSSENDDYNISVEAEIQKNPTNNKSKTINDIDDSSQKQSKSNLHKTIIDMTQPVIPNSKICDNNNKAIIHTTVVMKISRLLNKTTWAYHLIKTA